MDKIPVYEIKVPNYKIKEIENLSGKTHRNQWGHEIPVEYMENPPNFAAIAKPIVAWLRERYMGKRIGLRLLGSMEHEGKSVDDLVEAIKHTGHDRYDSKREGDRYENIENKKIEVFVLEVEVGKEKGDDGEEQVQHALSSFYYYPATYRGTPVRIDIGIVYDLEQLESVKHHYEGREDEEKGDGYVFKYPDRKHEAVLAILKIL